MIVSSEAYLNQIPNIIDSLSKFIAENGLLAAIILLIVLGATASVILLLYVLLQLIKLQLKAQDNSAERDRRIDRVSVRVDDVADKQEKVVTIIEPIKGAFDKLTTALDSNTELTRATVKSYQSIEESVGKSYDSTSIAIGISGDGIKKNSDANTVKIITAVEGVPQATATLLIEKFNELEIAISHLAANNSPDSVKAELAQLKIDFEKALENYLKRTTQNDVDLTAADKTIDAQAHQIEVLTHPDPLLSPIDGEANRKLIDATFTPADDLPKAVGQ